MRKATIIATCTCSYTAEVEIPASEFDHCGGDELAEIISIGV